MDAQIELTYRVMKMDRIDRLLAATQARLGRYTESRDPSEVLDPAVLDEADLLWEAAQGAAGDPQAVRVDVLVALGYLHL